MSPSANVRSISALRYFRASLIKFAEEADKAVVTMQSEVHRTTEWIENDRPSYWKEQIRRGFDRVSQCRIALETCRMRTVAGNRPSCIEEKKAFEQAKRRLQTAHEKVEAVRRWANKIRHSSDEFRGRIGQLDHFLRNDIPRVVMLLDRMIAALEAYAEMNGEESTEDFVESINREMTQLLEEAVGPDKQQDPQDETRPADKAASDASTQPD